MYKFVKSFAALTTIVLAAGASTARAHFPFIIPDENGAPRANVVFSETLEATREVDVSILNGAKLVVTDPSE